MRYFKREYFNKKDIKHYLKYGPMDFNFPQAFTYYVIFEIPFLIVVFIIFSYFA